MSTPPAHYRQTSSLAVVSLVCGILGFFVGITAPVAIITGHMARGEIRRNPERLDGDALALIGLILGYLVVGLWLLVILIYLLIFGGLFGLALFSSF